MSGPAFGSGATMAPPQTRTWEYDALGRVISDELDRDGSDTGLAYIDYYPTGDVKTLTSIMGHTVDYTYDTRHQIRRATELTANDATLSDLTYTTAGRIATATVRGATSGTPRVRERSVVYEYANDSSRPEELDVMRNTTGGDAYASFAYDGDGATTERTLHHPVDPQLDKTWGMVYDGTGRLRMLRRPGGGSEVYWYDHTGQRMLALERTDNGDPVKLRLWMGGTEVHYDGDGKETKTWAHVSLAGPAARIENRTDVEFAYHNGLGHLVLATKADGTDAMAYSYTAFGEVFDQKGDDPDAHLRRFNGKDVDAESGLAYYGFRYYDPVAMQWTRADPLFRFVPDMAFAEPRRANLYVFSLNNANRYLDPDGLRTDDIMGGCGGAMTRCVDANGKRVKLTPDPAAARVIARATKVATGIAIAAAGCAASVGAGCIAAAVYGADLAAEGITGKDGAVTQASKAAGVNPAIVHMVIQAGFAGYSLAKSVISGGGSPGSSRSSTNAATGPGCFVAGTPVRTNRGLVPIERVRAGDKVACADPGTGEWTWCAVLTPLMRRYTGSLVSMTFGDEAIEATADHPVWIVEGRELSRRTISISDDGVATDAVGGRWISRAAMPGRWVDAGHVEIGDVVWLAGGSRERVSGISVQSAAT